jgi:hypothetical protein
MSDTLWIDEKMYVVDDEVAVYCEKLEDELAECREWIKDVEETHLMVMNEWCPSDEQHCTCVPVLRREIAELKASHRAGTETAIRIHAKQEKQIAELKQKFVALNKELGCELMDPNGTIWEHAAKVQKENEELKRQIADGELISLEVVTHWIDYTETLIDQRIGDVDLQEFAKRKVQNEPVST